ncbi:MAG TPA: hypothetical protein VGN79_12375 [Devosia sp.]|jgi:hypothetical protein|nr:hypothetical protein [Devosia sp.]
MFFIRLGIVVAWLALILGIMQFGLGFYVASQGDADIRAAMTARYLGRGGSVAAINQGLILFVVGVALGILATIGNKISGWTKANSRLSA